MPSIEEFFSFCARTQPSKLRIGQHMSNMYSLIERRLSDSIIGSNIDPFYNDSNIEKFKEWLKENWNEQAEYNFSITNPYVDIQKILDG